MNYKTFLRTVALAMMFTLLTTLSALSQPTEFSVSVDKPDRVLPPGGFTTYEMLVRNTSGKDLKIVAERTVNDLPDDAWISSICSELHCYEEDVSLLPAEDLAAGDSTYVKMHVTAGNQIEDTAKIVLRFYVEGSQEYYEQAFNIATVEPKPTVFAVIANQKEMSTDAGMEVEFYVGLANYTSSPLDMTVYRVENDFPDDSWQSRLCVPDSCLPTAEVETPTVTIEPSKALYVRLRVFAGSGGEGKVTLRFDPPEGVDPAYEQFTVTATMLGVDVPGVNATLSAAYPNPTQTSVTIPLPDVTLGAGSISLVLYDERGMIVAELGGQATTALRMGSHTLSVDLSGLPAGTYRYVMQAAGKSQQGAIVLIR
jgi:hypothetical protein